MKKIILFLFLSISVFGQYGTPSYIVSKAAYSFIDTTKSFLVGAADTTNPQNAFWFKSWNGDFVAGGSSGLRWDNVDQVLVQGDLDLATSYGLGTIKSIYIGSEKKIDFGAGDAYIEESGYALKFSTYNGSSTALAMTILGNGYVGIGTATPDEKFEIEWSAGIDIELGRGSTGTDITFIKLRDANGVAWYWYPKTDGTLEQSMTKP